MTTITYDVDSDSSLYGKTFCQINDDDTIILMGKPFIHSIGFISYAMSHESAYQKKNDINTNRASTIYDYWACIFNIARKGRTDLCDIIYNPKHAFDIHQHTRGLYTPPAGKYFMCYNDKDKVQMLISPSFRTLVLVNGKHEFGKPWSYSLSEYLNVKELMQKYPNLKPHREYLQWLEDEMNAGNIKMKGNSVSINQQKLKEFL